MRMLLGGLLGAAVLGAVAVAVVNVFSFGDDMALVVGATAGILGAYVGMAAGLELEDRR